MLRNTYANGILVKSAMIFHSVILNTKILLLKRHKQGLDIATAVRKVLGSSLRHTLRLDQNKGTHASFEWIGKTSSQKPAM